MFEVLIDSLERSALEMKKIQEEMNIKPKEEVSIPSKTTIRPITIIIPMSEDIGEEKEEKVIADKNKNPIRYIEERLGQALGKIKWQ